MLVYYYAETGYYTAKADYFVFLSKVFLKHYLLKLILYIKNINKLKVRLKL